MSLVQILSANSQVERLVGKLESADATDLWRAISVEERTEAAESALLATDSTDLLKLTRLKLTSEMKGFRPSVFAQMKATECAKRIGRIPLTDAHLIRRYVTGWFLERHLEIQRAFFDAGSLPHNNGLIREDFPEVVAQAVVRNAAMSVLSSAQNHLIPLYLCALHIFYEERWPGIPSAFRTAIDALAVPPIGSEAKLESSSDIAKARVSATTNPSGQPAATDERPVASPLEASFRALSRQTALDQLIITAIVDAAAGGSGALLPSALDDVLNEVVRLQPRRHPSYFHLGFRDSVFEKPRAETIAAGNEDRWRWYLAGFLTGLAREGRHAQIVVVYDTVARARELGSGRPPSRYVAKIVFEALAAAGRHSEAARFVSPIAIRHDLSLAERVLTEAVELMRSERVAEAREYLDLLTDGLDRREMEEEVPEALRLEVNRRLAHCLRHDGNYSAARDLLQTVLLSEAVVPSQRAMVLGDLGLLKADIRQLAAIETRLSASDCRSLAEALERGYSEFSAAAAEDTPEASHGTYPIGMIHLLRGEAHLAFPLLDRALTSFDRERLRYEKGSLLSRVRFHTGLAGVASAMNLERVPQFLQWICDGLAARYQVPEHIIEHACVGAALRDVFYEEQLIDSLLEHEERATLRQLVSVDGVRSAARLGKALLVHASRVGVPQLDAVEDLHRAFNLLRRAGENTEAVVAIDTLQGFARDGVGVVRFESLVEDRDSMREMWESEDVAGALALLRETQGRYADASAVLAGVFHRMLSDAGYDRSAEAAGIVERIASYGGACAETAEELRSRLEGIAGRSTEVVRRIAQRRIRVLVVGGNEVQRQYEQPLKDWFAAEDRAIDPLFIRTGWTSNWQPFVDEFDRRKAGADALVVMQFIRTELGRTIRRRWPSQAQIGCWGHGFESIRRAIQFVADMARRNDLGPSVPRNNANRS